MPGVVSTIAGGTTQAFCDGVDADARFDRPSGMLVTRDGSRIFVADTYNHRIRAIDTATRAVTTIVNRGTPVENGVGLSASPSFPFNMAFDECSAEPESRIYFTDNHSVCCLTLALGMPFAYGYACELASDRCHRPDARQIVESILEPSGVVSAAWLLPDLWMVVAGFLARPDHGSRLPLSWVGTRLFSSMCGCACVLFQR
jgi:YVTN family beta-propeller protein